jgi:formate hydrogenlyase transcriptional activator
MDYRWPGNVRELENLIERAMVVASDAVLHIDAHWLESSHISDGRDATHLSLAELEQQAILAALERCHGRIYGPNGAAKALGLKPTTLYGKMRKHHISKSAIAH